MDRRRFEHLMVERVNRRRLLAGFGAAIAATSLRGRPTRVLAQGASPAAGENPFPLGVASGDPLPDGVVLWTRIVSDPLSGTVGSDPVDVKWEIARDERFANVVSSGSVTATPELAQSVHVDATGLEPDRIYVYRFIANGESSPVGRTRTAPANDATIDRLRFGFASCAHWEHGYFPAYRHLAQEEIDLVLFQGDYIYEYAPNGDFKNEEIDQPVRLFAGDGEIVSLNDYRLRHAQYKTDPDLQETHRLFPWIATWDDHEVENDYAGDLSSKGESTQAFLARRAAAYQAYYEHMPLRPDSMPHGPDSRLYRRLRYGNLAEITVLDTRQYRTDQPCGDTIAVRCDAALDPKGTLTGPDQEQWLLDGLDASTATWNVISQQTMMAELAATILGPKLLYNDDQWDGYPLARNRILKHIQDAGVPNAVVLSGDIHSAWANDLKSDYADPASSTVATEFVCASVTAFNPIGARLSIVLPGNPHIKFLDVKHGYTVCEVTPERWQTDFRAVASVADPASPVSTVGSFAIENGKPGAEQA